MAFALSRYNREAKNMADEKIKLPPEIEQLTEKLLADPKSRVFAQLADAYRKCGMFDEAIDTAKKGLEIHPQYAVAHLILGRCYMSKKMYALAREEFELTVRNDPQNLVGYRLLAETYERQNMYPEAAKYYQMVLDLDPTNVDIAEKVENLRGAIKPLEPVVKQMAPRAAPETEAPPAVEPEILTRPLAEPAASVPDTGPTEPKPEAIMAEPEPLAQDDTGQLQAESGPAAEPGEPETVAEEAVKKERTATAVYPSEPEPAPEAEATAGSTATLAELYASQGHYEKAVEAYRELIAAEPENQAYKSRMDELLGKAFPELSPAPELAPVPEASLPSFPPEDSAAMPAESKPVEDQAVELTGMFAEMEKLAAVAEPAPPSEPVPSPKPEPAPQTGYGGKSVEEEPAAAALSALFADEPQPMAHSSSSPAGSTQPDGKAEPGGATGKSEENAVSSFQAWLNSIQK